MNQAHAGRDKLRAAVVGVGYLGKFHAEKYEKIKGVELIAVADPNARAREEVARRHRCEALADYRELLGRVDLVSVVTPTLLHAEVAKFFIENGVHVLLEKPICATLEEARAVVRLAHEKNVKLQVGHIERYNPAILALREALKGKPKFIQAHRIAPFEESARIKDVDVIVDLMIHDIEIIQFLLQSAPQEVIATGAAVLSSHIDIANASVRFENGCLANVTASRVSMRKERIMRIFEKDSYYWVDMYARVVSHIHKSAPGETPAAFHEETGELTADRKSFPKSDALLDELSDFVSAVREDRTPTVTGEAGLEALKTALLISDMIRKQINP